MTDSATETRCPSCQTVFAVEADDLERAGGKVRCGDCMQVFDARAHAVALEQAEVAGARVETQAPQAADVPEAEAPVLAPETDQVHEADEAVPAVETDETAEADDTHAAEDLDDDIDDEQFTRTNWFIVDEAGELAPAEATAADDSGAFRFGDDTPPDTLRAELAALVGDDVPVDGGDAEADDDAPRRAPEQDDAAPEAAPVRDGQDDAAAPDASLVPGDSSSPIEADGPGEADADWDDLLGELDDALGAQFGAPEPAVEDGTPEQEIAGDDVAAGAATPEAASDGVPPEWDDDADSMIRPGTELGLAGELEAAAAAGDAADTSEPLDFQLVDADEAGSETSVDLDLTRATAGIEAPDFELVEYEDAARAAGTDEDAGTTPPPEAAFDAGALDDLMAAVQALDTEAVEDEGEASEAAAEAAHDTDADADDDATIAPAADAPAADAAPDEAGTDTVGEDTINAMAEGERGEVIVLGGDDTPGAAPVAARDADVAPDEDDDTSFAESMIISPDLAPKRPRRTGLWGTLSLLALVALLVQAVHTWRGTLATKPYFQDALPRIYGALGIDVQPEWDITQWCVETSGALASDAGLDVESIFSNRGDTPLPPPVLKVRIVDAYSDTLAATVIEPADYLPGAGVPDRIAPGGRITALARLDYSEPRLDGYEVSLCYAGPEGTLRCGTGCPADE